MVAENKINTGTDEGHSKWILAAITRIKSQKQRPSDHRIASILQSHHNVSYENTVKYLKAAVNDGVILSVVNKGVVTYKDPGKVSRLQSRLLEIAPGKDFVKAVVRCVREIGDPNGTSLCSLESYLHRGFKLQLKEGTNFTALLKLQVKKAVLQGLLEQNGGLLKLTLADKSNAKVDHLRTVKCKRRAVEFDHIELPTDVILPFERNKVSIIIFSFML